MKSTPKKASVRDIAVVTANKDDDASWLKNSLNEAAKPFIKEIVAKYKQARQGHKKGGATAAAMKKAKALTTEQIAAAEQTIRNSGERVTNKKIAKTLGGLHPDYIRRRRRQERT